MLLCNMNFHELLTIYCAILSNNWILYYWGFFVDSCRRMFKLIFAFYSLLITLTYYFIPTVIRYRHARDCMSVQTCERLLLYRLQPDCSPDNIYFIFSPLNVQVFKFQEKIRIYFFIYCNYFPFSLVYRNHALSKTTK